MKKIVIFFTLILCFWSSLFCKGIYDKADKKTQSVLKEVNELLEKNQFETAFQIVSSEDNEFILAKKVEIACSGFSQSMMHQMFAFKNLEENETLYDVRTSDGSFSFIVFDPVKSIEHFTELYGEKPILNYALGMYYQDILNRYKDKWLISTDELINNTILYFQKALDANCYDDYSLSNLATNYYRVNDLESSINIYQKKEKEFKLNATDNYHYGIILWLTGNPKKGIEYAKKSIDGYNDDPEYQIDAYIICARICFSIPDYKNAEKFLSECRNAYPKEYRVSQYTVTLYALQNDKENTIKSAMELFELGPTNPTTCQLIIQECNDAKKPELAIEFFKEAVLKYENDGKACENLYFHYAYEYYLMEKTEEAKQMALKARAYFEKNNTLTPDVEQLLNTLCGE